MKKTSSRSQRGSRGIKGKHVLQICVLLGVFIWLIYQVKYSHDKKKEFYEADGKKSTVLLESEEGMVKLGRKDLLPGYHKQNEKEKHVEVEEEDEEEEEEEKESKSTIENNSTHEEEDKEDEEEVAEEDEEDKNKLGEEVVEEDEEDNKHEEDSIDEQDESKTAEKDEKETETNHAEEIDMTVHEAREEHYKADDASSAVSHESRILNTERLKEGFGNLTGPAQENSSNATVSEVEVQKEPVLKSGEAVEKTDNAVTELRGETVNGNSTEAVLEASGFLQNETRTMQERSQEHDRTEDGAPPSGSSDLQTLVQLEQTRNETDANVIVSANITITSSIQDESRNSTSKPSLIENVSRLNTTELNKESSRYEGDDETEEKESSDHFATEQTEEADDTTLESTMLQEEREALTDPQTLPDINIEGKEEEDEEEAMAAE